MWSGKSTKRRNSSKTWLLYTSYDTLERIYFSSHFSYIRIIHDFWVMLLSSQLYSQQKAENFVFLSISSLFLTIRTNCTATLSKYGCDQHHGQKLNFVYREISKENVLCVCVWKNAMLSKVNSFKNAPFALNGPQFTVCFICRYISMRSKHFFSRVQAQTELFFMQMEYIYFCCCTLLVRLLLIVLSQGFRVHLELVVLCVCVCVFFTFIWYL